MEKILLGLPYYPRSVEAETMLAAMHDATKREDRHVMFSMIKSTGTAKGFNLLWAQALTMAERGELTHFAMIHGDIVPQQGVPFIDVLLDELDAGGFQLVSAVSPIKDERGLTSTGVDWFDDDPWQVRRFTTAEVDKLPMTFTATSCYLAGLNPDERPLLVNTALWACDLRDPVWFERDENQDAYFVFTFFDRIRRDAEGVWRMGTISEDWHFSRLMAKRNVRYAATRKIPLRHIGDWPFPNDRVWGAWQTDQVQPKVTACSSAS